MSAPIRLPPATGVRRLISHLLRPIDFAWLATFRALYGLVLAVSMLRFCLNDWIDTFFVEPSFHFKYWGFEWVEPLSAGGMHALFVVLTGLALAVASGTAFRLTAPALAAGLTYIQLIDVSTYLNHYYLAALLAWLLSISPAHRRWSVDAWIAARRGRPAPASIPAAWSYLFRIQVGLVYFFAGIAKAQPDWLIHGQPLRIWLGASADLPVLGTLFAISWVPLAMSWCGFLFDTTIAGWLLYRRTRPYAYVVCIVFHTLTRLLFPIGMFPVIMVLAATVFFDPAWPRNLAERAVALARRLRASTRASAPIEPAVPVTASAIRTPFESSAAIPLRQLGAGIPARQVAALSIAAAYCVIQLCLPLRFLVYGGNVLWHEQGMRFSWRVMVRAKGGNTTFIVKNRVTGRTYHVSPRAYLTSLQESEMSSQPDLILQLAHHIHRDFERRGLGPVEVYADTRVSLNGRRGVRMIDPSVDLVAVHDGLGRATWVLPAPLEKPPHTKPVL